jgi:hypothetical protein
MDAQAAHRRIQVSRRQLVFLPLEAHRDERADHDERLQRQQRALRQERLHGRPRADEPACPEPGATNLGIDESGHRQNDEHNQE